MMYRVIKNRKRLYIVDDKDQVFYTPPDFVTRIPNRDVLQEVADYWNQFGYDIKIIMEMEAKYSRRKTK